MNIEDRIIVSYDEHIQSSPCLVVARECHKEMHLINTFWNDKGGCIGAEIICSCCNKDNRHDEYMDYCPNCGAEMRKANDS